MDFDLADITVPFRMQPGLRRLAPGARQLTPLAEGSALWREKKAVMASGASRHKVAGFDEGPALAAIHEQALLEGISSGQAVELAFEEDFAVLDGRDTTLPWLCVCVPSHWAPEEKLGLPFAAVHAPVADARLLVAASSQLVALATGGERWERTVWTISPSARHDQHPHRQPREPWPEAEGDALAASCHFRAERQTFFPVGRGTQQAVFTIRVMVEPLESVVDEPHKAARLHDAIASMTPAVLQYKGLAPARDRLLASLHSRRT